MAGYFRPYSPWTDAASYGSGFGQAVSQALLDLPRQRAAFAIQQQEAQRRNEEFPLQQRLLQAQVQNTQMRPQFEEERLRNAAESLGLRQQGLDVQQQLAQARQALLEAQAAATEKKNEQPLKPEKVVNPSQQADAVKLAQGLATLLAPTQQAGTQPDISAMLGSITQPNANVPALMAGAQRAEHVTPAVPRSLTHWRTTPATTNISFLPPEVQQVIAQAMGGSNAPPPAAQQLQPQAQVPTATGPGGKKLMLVNGQWVPAN